MTRNFFFRNRYPLLYLLLVLWMSPGFFPLISYEADAMSISTGCEMLCHDHNLAFTDNTYGYWMQPLTYLLVAGLRFIVPCLSCEALYSIVTIICTLVLIPAIVALIHRLTGLGKCLLLLTLFLFPETYAVAFYPNSSVLPLLGFVWSLILITHSRPLFAAAVMCILPLFRLDIVTIYPMILPVCLMVGYGWRRALVYTGATAACVVVATFIGYWLSGADILFTYNEYGRWEEIVTPARRLTAIYGFYSIVNFVLVPIGLYLMIRRRRWMPLIYVMGAVLLIHIVNFRFGNASKHFLYLLPFVPAASAVTLKWCITTWRIRRSCSWLAGGILVFAAAVQVIGVTAKRYRTVDTIPIETQLRLATFHIGGLPRDVAVCLGSGFFTSTADEVILSSGYLFYPWLIHDLKSQEEASRMQVEKLFEVLAPQDMLWTFSGEDELRCFIQARKSGLPLDSFDAHLDDILYDYSPDDGDGLLIEAIDKIRRDCKEAQNVYIPYFPIPGYRTRIAIDRLCQLGLLRPHSPGIYTLAP